MDFVDKYIYYFDEKGSRIRKLDALLNKNTIEENKVDEVKISDRTIMYPDGSKYEGDIADGLKHGKGKFTKGSNYSFEG